MFTPNQLINMNIVFPLSPSKLSIECKVSTFFFFFNYFHFTHMSSYSWMIFISLSSKQFSIGYCRAHDILGLHREDVNPICHEPKPNSCFIQVLRLLVVLSMYWFFTGMVSNFQVNKQTKECCSPCGTKGWRHGYSNIILCPLLHLMLSKRTLHFQLV